METLSISARDFEVPAHIDSELRERVARLEELFGRIVRCRVTLEGPGGHRGRGKYRAVVSLVVPHRELTASRQADESLGTAVRRAFDAAERQLEDYAHVLRGEVKAHARRS